MGSRLLVQFALTYGVAVAKALWSAWRVAAQDAGTAGGAAAANAAANTSLRNGVSIQEAIKILNVPENFTLVDVESRFNYIYASNGPEKGASFYLQSKAFRARETLVYQLDQQVANERKKMRAANRRAKKDGENDNDEDVEPPSAVSPKQ